MRVYLSNDVKIYNLSYGKSVPEWLTEREQKNVKKQDREVQRRLQLIHDFQHNDVGTALSLTKDGNYVFSAGLYKPVVKCFELENLSLKFEQGVFNDIKKVINISDDYRKFVLMEANRYLEIFYQHGLYFSVRIPTYGRDMTFCNERSEIVVTGLSDEIYRLNLERGEFLHPFLMTSKSGQCIDISDQHQLIACGTIDGCVECFDHRDRSRVGVLDIIPPLKEYCNGIPRVTAIKFKDALHFAVGSSSGQVLLYDIRSSRPLLVKDLLNELPVKKIDFAVQEDETFVLSMDSRALKVWNERNGKPVCAIEPRHKLNDFVRYPDSGVLFMSPENSRMLQYFVPVLGNAPKWCSYMEALTEELEETDNNAVYDAYKFVTEAQLEQLGLQHLIGTEMLRAYMHGYFMDMRLYNKATQQTQPFALEQYRKKKMKEAVAQERKEALAHVKKTAVQSKKVNREMAERLAAEAEGLITDKDGGSKVDVATSLLQDSRFTKMFESEEFEVDKESHQYRGTMKMLEKAAEQRREREQRELRERKELEEKEGIPKMPSDDEKSASDDDRNSLLDSESESEKEDVYDQKKIDKKEEERKEAKAKERKRQAQVKKDVAKRLAETTLTKPSKFTLHTIETGENTKRFLEQSTEQEATALPMSMRKEQMTKKDELKVEDAPFGGKTATFKISTGNLKAKHERFLKRQHQDHIKERKKVRRSAAGLPLKTKK